MMATEIEPTQKIGIIGLGRMGTAMAINVLKSGFKVTVFNRSESKATPLVELGAIKAKTPKEVALNSDIVVSSLRDNNAVLEVISGKDGYLQGFNQTKFT